MSEQTTIRRYEELAINAFPAISTEMLDGWLLRYSNGYTYRGNCVNPLYSSSMPFQEHIAACEKRYAAKNLPCIFKITPDTPPALDGLLEQLGYCDAKHADIMTRKITPLDFEREQDVLVEHAFTERWLTDFAVQNGTASEPDLTTIQKMLQAIPNPVFCSWTATGDQMTGCALGVQEDAYFGIFDVRVSESHRRQGIATRICLELMRQAAKQHASVAYLQVASENRAAIRLYEKLGFHYAYTYWYRVK